jgi:branched-chain amino acid transport system permease protein
MTAIVMFRGKHAALLPAVASVFLIPYVLPEYAVVVLSYAFVFSIACLGLNLLFGMTGLLSFGHAAFFGVGAYAGAFLYRFGPVNSFEAYVTAGIVAATATAALFGHFCVRTSRIYFAILTLGFTQIVHALFVNGTVFRLFGDVGKGLYYLGGGGLYIPRLSILGVEYGSHDFTTVLYHVIALSFLASAAVLWRIVRSPFGLALRAIRDNETRASFIGIPVRRYRYIAFVVSGAVVGLAGALFGQLGRQITPEHLDWLFSAKLILMIVLGGSRDFLGPLLGAFAFVGLGEAGASWPVSRNLVMGLGLIIVVMVFPRGLAGGIRTAGEWMRHILR